ncbi:hypothetical protein CDD82_7156 [Ophiocordyceps australis]|uniref:Uncharacterized protein n=1 Tax=Ophiocordyceps australis TaxID=1399860 RepID=A0A2C5YSU9_9HYPO|nr:hypothetical protein CDD82_7156 [Ophiocordyceps australis]
MPASTAPTVVVTPAEVARDPVVTRPVQQAVAAESSAAGALRELSKNVADPGPPSSVMERDSDSSELDILDDNDGEWLPSFVGTGRQLPYLATLDGDVGRPSKKRKTGGEAVTIEQRIERLEARFEHTARAREDVLMGMDRRIAQVCADLDTLRGALMAEGQASRIYHEGHSRNISTIRAQLMELVVWARHQIRDEDGHT